MKFTLETPMLITGHVDLPLHRFCRWDGKTHKEIMEEDADRRQAYRDRLAKVEADVADVQAQIERIAQ